MKFIKGLIKFILGLLIIVILLGGGTYVFVRVKYGIDPINTINQLSQLKEKSISEIGTSVSPIFIPSFAWVLSNVSAKAPSSLSVIWYVATNLLSIL